MTPTDPRAPQEGAGQTRRPGAGGGATYRHPADQSPGRSYHDGVHDHEPEDELHNPEVAHEHIDVNIRALVMSAVALVVVTAAAHLVVLFVFSSFEQEAAAKQPAPSPVAMTATQMPANTVESPVFNATATAVAGPRLLTNEPKELQKQRSEEATRLHGYGWANQSAGVAFMPIENAKKLILERGLASRPESTVSPTLGTRFPSSGESSGGRVITVPLPEAPAGAAAPAPAAPKPH